MAGLVPAIQVFVWPGLGRGCPRHLREDALGAFARAWRFD